MYASVRPSKNKVGIELIWNSTVHTRAGRVHDRCYGYTSGSSPVGACRVLNCLWKTRSSFVVTALPVILHACDITTFIKNQLSQVQLISTCRRQLVMVHQSFLHIQILCIIEHLSTPLLIQVSSSGPSPYSKAPSSPPSHRLSSHHPLFDRMSPPPPPLRL